VSFSDPYNFELPLIIPIVDSFWRRNVIQSYATMSAQQVRSVMRLSGCVWLRPILRNGNMMEMIQIDSARLELSKD
jgi:hypothetical protein